MKINNFVIAALIVSILFSCSKENNIDTNGDNKDASLALSISTKTMTKVMEGEANVSTLNIQSMIIELYDADKNIIGIGRSLTTKEIANVTSSSTPLEDKSRVVIEDVPQNAVYAKLYAYQKANETSTNLSDGINNFQNGFNNVPFFTSKGSTESPFNETTGLITINKTSNFYIDSNGTDHKIWTIEAEMSAYLARFEIKGELKASSVEPLIGGIAKPWAEITVTGIYINNIKNNITASTPTLVKGNHLVWGNGDWSQNTTEWPVDGHPFKKTPNTANINNWSNMFDVNIGEESNAITNTALFANTNAKNVAAYHIFPQGTGNSQSYIPDSAPHIIVRLLITPDRTIIDKTPYYAFITLKKFLVSQTSVDLKNYLNIVERGKVYRIDLSKLADLNPTDPNPDPESESTPLLVSITIKDWTEVILKPNL